MLSWLGGARPCCDAPVMHGRSLHCCGKVAVAGAKADVADLCREVVLSVSAHWLALQ
jgi:hypothetical protein